MDPNEIPEMLFDRREWNSRVPTLSCALRKPGRQKQYNVAVGAFLRQPEIREVAGIVNHRDAFTANFRHEPGGLAKLPKQISALPLEVSAFLAIQLTEIKNGFFK